MFKDVSFTLASPPKRYMHL